MSTYQVPLLTENVDSLLRSRITSQNMQREYGIPKRQADALSEYINRENGEKRAKRIRPSYVFATAIDMGKLRLESVTKYENPNVKKFYPLAATIELDHNFFLIPDDMVDNEITDMNAKRRGGPAYHVQHGIPYGINDADSLRSISDLTLVRNEDMWTSDAYKRIVSMRAEMLHETGQGQDLEITRRKMPIDKTSIEDVDKIHEMKSGYTQIGVKYALTAMGYSNLKVDRLTGPLKNITKAFQDMDDVIGTIDLDIGKSSDLDEGKRTKLLRMLYDRCDPSEREWVCGIVRNGPEDERFGRDYKINDDDKNKIIVLMNSYGVVDEVKESAVKNLEEGNREIIKILGKEMPYTVSMNNYCVYRKF